MEGRTDLSELVIGAAIEVHRTLGPGLLESTYEACLVFELVERGAQVERQKALPVRYRGVVIDCGYRIDLLVGGQLIVDVERILPVHEAQLLTYLRLSGLSVGLLLNFNVPVLKSGGIKRMVHEARS